MAEEYTVGQTWAALRKSWKGYRIAKNKNQPDLAKTYQEQIQTLQTRLGVAVSSFEESTLPEVSPVPEIVIRRRHSKNAVVKFAACFYCRQEKKDFRQFPTSELMTYANVYVCKDHYQILTGVIQP